MSKIQIWSDIDLTTDGARHGFLRLPTSAHRAAYGTIMIPIASIRNGVGPRVVVIAGNHGDEYEGQLVVMDLMRTLRKEDVQGQIILLSALNAPAVHGDSRTSPFDDGNLNRLFPGRADGTPTEIIAHFIETVILPGSDLVIDLHSGGSSLEYIPSAVIVSATDRAKLAQLTALLEIFAAPISFVTDAPTGGDRSLASACDRNGNIPCLSTELGGGGTVSTAALRMARAGLLRILKHVGVLPRTAVQPPTPTRIYRRVPFQSFVFAPCAGIFEPKVDLGEFIERGSVGGAIHNPWLPWQHPQTVVFEQAGIVLCRKYRAHTVAGDCLFNIGVPFEEVPR